MTINLVDENGKLIGRFSFYDATQMAKSRNMDLVMVNGKTNTYKIADAGKLKYDQKQHDREVKANNRAHKLKEIKIRPVIQEHDINVKLNQIREFLGKGFKTRIVMVLKGRQKAFKEDARVKFLSILNVLIQEKLIPSDTQPTFDGRDFSAILSPTQK